MAVAARKILVEFDIFEAAATLVCQVARREHDRHELRLLEALTGETTNRAAEGLRRELRDVESAEMTLRAALWAPAEEWGGIEQYQAEDR